MGSQNAVMGEEYGTDLPLSTMPEQDLTTERNAAKFSRTKEYQQLKNHLEERVDYYKSFLPGGTAVINSDKPTSELGEAWKVAALVITELEAIIQAYERANEVVRDAARRENS